jgi:hypothetical protein
MSLVVKRLQDMSGANKNRNVSDPGKKIAQDMCGVMAYENVSLSRTSVGM